MLLKNTNSLFQKVKIRKSIPMIIEHQTSGEFHQTNIQTPLKDHTQHLTEKTEL